jgi:acetyltransferase-like isoleucine patch superfamily enzyme
MKRIYYNKSGFPKNSHHNISSDFKIGSYKNIEVSKNALVNIKSNVTFKQFCNVLILEGAELFISDNVFFNNYCSINCLGKITIGENTILGEGVKMYDHNHAYNTTDDILVIKRKEFTIGNIKIGNNCWIGSNVTILKDVEIGNNVIVGANNLIYKSIPSNSIVKSNFIVNIESVSNF